MIVKEHKNQGRLILAVCDEELIGKKFEEDDKQLDMGSSFYDGVKKSEEEVKEMMKKAYIINIVGKESIETAKSMGFVSENEVIKIKGIPHVQCVNVGIE